MLGRIDLDPASCALANSRIRAARYYTAADNGLSKPWHGNVFLNPPGDPRGRLVKAFWRRAVEHAAHGGTVLWVGFSLEQLRSLQNWADGEVVASPMRYPLVIARQRIRWTSTRQQLVISGKAERGARMTLSVLMAELPVTIAAKYAMGVAHCVIDAIQRANLGISMTLAEDSHERKVILHVTSPVLDAAPIRVRGVPPGLEMKVRHNASPTHANYFSLLGGSKAQRQRFASRFSQFGEHMTPQRALPLEARDLQTEVIAAVALADPGTLSGRDVVKRVRARQGDVFRMIRALREQGRLDKQKRKLWLVGGA